MVKKPKRRSKHVPRRTCVGCREVLAKRSMIRIVRGPEGVQVDLTGKAHGRGAYLHDQRSCWLKGINGALDHALRTRLTDQEKKDLLTYMENYFSDERMAQTGTEESSR
ncbi:MAG: YlxR family protein [Chloroflexota bacterium]|nr:YlxR family protein [Chloroflexota bacterium]